MHFSRRRSVLPGLAAAAFLLLAWAADRAQRESWRQTLVALDAGDAAAVCAASGFPLSDFWERAKAMGVSAMALRAERLRDLAERGQVLVFSRSELEKWKSLGLITPTVALKPNVLWVKDPKLCARVADALRTRHLVASTGTASGHGIIDLVQDPDPATPTGFNPEGLDIASSLGLFPLRMDASGEASLQAGGAMTIFAAPRTIAASARLPELLRAIYSQPGRLLVLRLDAAAGVEDNLSRLRSLLRPLRERELLARGGGVAGIDPELERRGAARWRRWLAWLLAVLGPIVAVRLSVKSFKLVRREVRERRPVASPVAELVLGVLAAAAAAATVGLGLGLLLAGSSAAKLPESLAFSTMAWPLAIGALALYPFSRKVLMRKLRGSPSYLDLLRFAALALAAALLFWPRLLLAGTPLWAGLKSVVDASDLLWWWPWRWREFLVGLPALLYALYLVGRQLDDPEPHPQKAGLLDDPRPWLWLGLLFPIGTIAALGRPGAVPGQVLGQTLAVLAAGLVLGGILLAVRTAGETGDQSPPAC